MEDTLTNYIQTLQQTTTTTQRNNTRLIFNINNIRDYNSSLAAKLITENMYYLPILEEELIIQKIIPSNIQIGFTGQLGVTHSPRTINSTNIGQLLRITGIVTKTTAIRPKLKKSVHFKSKLGNQTCYDPFKMEYTRTNQSKESTFVEKEYRDYLSISKYPQTSIVVPKTIDNILLNMEQGYSEYYDYQMVTIQELPENSPVGVMPVSMEVVLTYDLCDKLKPGDRPVIYGTLKSFGGNIQSADNSIIRTVLIANNVETNKNEIIRISSVLNEMVTDELLNNLHEFIAPSIYGLRSVKRSLLLQMLSTNSNNIGKLYNNSGPDSNSNRNIKRSTINILLVGDPSTAKSQLLRYILNTTELSISTTGRGSSGVGLTASVIVSDDGSNDRILAAGALVLSDGGICCIDEFDKMSHFDRIALHEAMEQGTVSISKAGIHATLNSRTCVLAAANPILGSYNDEMSVGDNLGLEMSLISRFDVVWVVRDERNEKIDFCVASHVLNLPNDMTHDPMSNISNTTASKTPSSSVKNFGNTSSSDIQNFIKHHIAKAKALDTPNLSRSAAELLINFYTELRKVETQTFSRVCRTKSYTKKKVKESNVFLQLPVTPRVLDSLIRLAVSNARLHLRREVHEEDVLVAIDIIKESRSLTIPNTVNDTVDTDNESISDNNRHTSLAEPSGHQVIHQVKTALLHFKELGGAVNFEYILDYLGDIDEQVLTKALKHLDEEEGLIMFSNGLVLFLD
ncbi:DNA replication licensing factor MCM3 like protein 1 [Cucumispora dikerogammari]|nr:DNA replication licensing factor MCM3 like protein 1 [Cucumispora dikerogammari]